MAKRRKSRRSTPSKPTQQDTKAQATEAVAPDKAEATAEPQEDPGLADASAMVQKFAGEYYYVYEDVRNVMIIGVVMVAIMIGLGYVI